MDRGAYRSSFPPITGVGDLEVLEQVPFAERLDAGSTYDLLHRSADRHGERPALSFVAMDADASGDPLAIAVTWRYADLIADVTRAANLFKSYGLTQRDSVGIVLPHLPEGHLALWGAEACGLACLVNPLLDDADIAGLLRTAQVRVLVTLAPAAGFDLWPRMARIATDLPGLKAILRVDPLAHAGRAQRLKARAAGLPARLTAKPPKGVRCEDFRRALARMPGDALRVPRHVRPNTAAALTHTAGNTGTPKLIRQSHGNQRYMAWAMAGVAQLADTDVVLSGLPLSHNGAALTMGLAPFSVGAHVIMTGAHGFRSPGVLAGFWGLVERHRATAFAAVPPVFDALLNTPSDAADASSLRVALCTAGALSPDTFKRFEDRTGLAVLEGFGLAEAGGASAFNPLHGPRRIGSAGLRLPYQTLRIVAAETDGGPAEDMAPGRVGRLLVHGPNVCLDARAPGGPTAVDDEGWLDTGDLARLDDDGYLWLVGRADDRIHRDGRAVDPAAVETALAAHDAVAGAAVVARPDRRAGAVPSAFVTLKPGAWVDALALLEHARARLDDPAAHPVAVEILDRLPSTASGRLHKAPLRLRATEHAVRDALNRRTIEAEVTARLTGAGLAVTVVPKLARDVAEARRALGQWPVAVTVIAPDDAAAAPPARR
ncbi:hypothetical protein CCR80_04565 [Rhodothalassium salexigens]|uniref:AMP-binding protein n=1 Tax=Rhodothalassium salexigens TaxID=1086 RepID=UPI001911B241|nr:hypothetical protein [Rhodothalassium salexigens]